MGTVERDDDDVGYTVVKKRRRKPKPKILSAPSTFEVLAAPDVKDSTRRRKPPKNQAVIIKKPADISSYAEMLKSVKNGVLQKDMDYEITTSRRSGI